MVPRASFSSHHLDPGGAANAGPPRDEASLREALKRCSAATFEAARDFLHTGDPRLIPAIVHGVVERYVEADLRPKLASANNELRLSEDLGIDSLTMMEIVILAEDVFPVSIHNQELRRLRTLEDVIGFITEKVRA